MLQLLIDNSYSKRMGGGSKLPVHMNVNDCLSLPVSAVTDW